MRVLVWGAGVLGRRCVERLRAEGIEAASFIDRRPPEDGTCLGIPVLTPEETATRGFAGISAVLLAFTTDKAGPVAFLEQAGFHGVVTTFIDGVPVASLCDARADRARIASIYPHIGAELAIEPGLDVLLLDCPPRFLALMPNGLGYVHNMLQKSGLRFQTVDADLVFYHRFHSDRILNRDGDGLHLTTGEVIADPWGVDTAEKAWSDPNCLDRFRPDIDELVAKVVAARPRLVGFSLHDTNLPITREVAAAVRQHLPETLILTGGYDCVYYDVGPNLFTEFDYMAIGEAETTLPALLHALHAGERPRDLPGIISRWDTPGRPWEPAPLLHDLDAVGFPRYEWADLNAYRNWNGYQLTPIVLSRGCRWSLCTFCHERFRWRIRSPKSMADEIQWLHERGCRLFHFNDSDLSGDPDRVAAVCDELRDRKLDLSLIGQLRIHKKHDLDYFKRLKAGGFAHLRFGVDAFSRHTLRLQNKGYTVEMIERTMRACTEAGIMATGNLVIGVPRETEEDVDETIENIVRFKPWIRSIENINTLILGRGGFYWDEPAKYGIRFRGDEAEIKRAHPKFIPSDLWYSEDPFIDQEVRLSRLERILRALHENGVDIGPYAARIVQALAAAGQKPVAAA